MLRYAPAALAFLLALPAAAQTEAEDALIGAFEAEHAAWEEDLERWQADHEDAVDALRAAIERMRDESMLDRHMDKIERHGDDLSDTDLADLAGMHARVRSAHEELRESHHHLMDTIVMLQRVVDEDMGEAGGPAESESDARAREFRERLQRRR